MFPPVSQEAIDAGYQDFADRWNPILDVFDEVGVRFAHEVHPSEIAYDYWTTVRTLEAIGHRPAFGLNWDPSHFMWQQLNPVDFILEFKDLIYHVDCKDVKLNVGNGRNGRLGSHLAWADLRRGWDFVSTGRGDVPWEASFRALNSIGYDGPISVEWEDAGMDRLLGAPEALEFVKRNAFAAPDGGLRRGVLHALTARAGGRADVGGGGVALVRDDARRRPPAEPHAGAAAGPPRRARSRAPS